MGGHKAELLAPAGNYESFLGALHAGADAVYLGGEKYGARAYADNFTQEEICRAIDYAHIFGRKLYLTVNTLVRESEYGGVLSYLAPFYQAGLDGVIVQDLGVLMAVRDAFPGLALHASTQMTLTGAYGASMLRDLGVTRIVPARELSLSEVADLKKDTGLELETFVHGAMCYCYSGQCLFSSMLGGRSGNRGRCAQPCRLPYQIGAGGTYEAASYPLSMKDMCSISLIPKLIEAGIDSFKIEGRMKKPEYAAGVTALYRKYIDQYYEKGRECFLVSKEDMQSLSGLYIRSEIQDGYYFRQNGKEMITASSPAYSGSDERILHCVRKAYLEKPLKMPVRMDAVFEAGKPAMLTVRTMPADPSVVGECVTVTGQTTALADRHPVSADNIRAGLMKLGNTPFEIKDADLTVRMDEGIFYPLKEINALRRLAVERLTKACSPRRRLPQEKGAGVCGEEKPKEAKENASLANGAKEIRVLVSTGEQLDAVLEADIPVSVLYLESEWEALSEETLDRCRLALGRRSACRLALALPYVVRRDDLPFLESLKALIKRADGCLVRNMESYAWLRSWDFEGAVYLDAGMYCYNVRTAAFWLERADGFCLPYELNAAQQRSVVAFFDRQTAEQVFYGRIPLMISANCVAGTSGRCLGGEAFGADGRYLLKDRMHKEFPVGLHCKNELRRNCYNVIYNSVPLSLHEKMAKKIRTAVRLQFTVETGPLTKKVLDFFGALAGGERAAIPYAEYTTGQERRGVE